MMTITEASEVQTVLTFLHLSVDPLHMSPAELKATFDLAKRSHDVLGAGVSGRTIWAQHEPLEGIRP